MRATTGFYWIKVIDILLVLLAITATIYIYVFNPIPGLTIAYSIAIAVLAVSFALYKSGLMKRKAVKESAISKLALLDDEGEMMQSWDLQGMTSLVIGKSAVQEEVDINLSGADYAALISKQHAVLNLVEGQWFLEDLHSRNGVGLKKARQQSKRKLEIETPHPIDVGDVIYIANTRLLVL